MFRPKHVLIPLEPFGPLEMHVPGKIMQDRKALEQYHTSMQSHIASDKFSAVVIEMKESLASLVQKHVLPRLPSASAVGKADHEWPPAEDVAYALALGMRVAELKVDNPANGYASPGAVIAAHSTFTGFDDDQLVDALMCWLCWVGFVARVNGLVKMDLVTFFRVCLLRSGDLKELRSDA